MFDPQHLHKLARWLWLRRVKKVPGLLQLLNYFLTGCDLPFSVQIGKRVRFQHYGSGCIVNHQVTIGDDVTIHPQVVIGQNVRAIGVSELTRIVIGDRVQLGTGAKILGSGEFHIGADALIGANAVVLHSVPAGCTAVGVPARIIGRKGA
jgi:serine O-acetyltransferase